MKLIPSKIRKKLEHKPNLLKIVDNISWLFVDKILRMGVGLVVAVWIARYLGPEQFGLINFANAFVGLFGVIAGLGLQGVVVRDIVRNPSTTGLTLGTTAVMQLLASVTAFLFTLGLIAYVRPDELLTRTVVTILGAITLFKASEIAVYWFESQVQSKYTVWVQNGVFLIFSIVKIILIISNASLVSFVWAMLAEAAIVALILIVVMVYRGPSLLSLSFNMCSAKKLLKDSWPLILSSLSVMIYMKIDQVMIGLIVGDSAVGVYSAAVRLAEIWYFVPVAIVASVFPSILKTHSHSKIIYKNHVQSLCDFLMIFGFLISLPVAFFSKEIVAFLYGENYASSATVLAIYIIGIVFISMAVVGNQWYLTMNRSDLALKRDLSGALINIVLNLLFIPDYGAVGAAFSTIFSYFIAHLAFDYLSPDTRDLFFIKIRALNIIAGFHRLTKLKTTASNENF